MLSKPRHALATLLATAALTATGSAGATIIDAGTTYGYQVRGAAATSTASITGVTFDGVAESFLLSSYGGVNNGNVTARITESDTDLGGGLHEVRISLRADGDLFPDAGSFGGANIGWAGADPLNLLRPAMLTSAVIAVLVGDTVLGSGDALPGLAGAFSSLNPWDGFFANGGGTAIGFGGAGGHGINGMDLIFRLQEPGRVPEPQSLALALLALGLLGASKRHAR